MRKISELIRPRDLAKFFALVGGGSVVQLVPRSWDPALSEGLLTAYTAVFPSTLATLCNNLRVLPDAHNRNLDEIARAHLRMRLEDGLGRLRGMRRRGWRPQVEIAGLENVRRALDRRRGAVIWAMRLSSATALKQGFCDAGFPLVHLSRAEHGASSPSVFGVRVVAPLFCRAENVLLQERLRIPLNQSPRYLSIVRDRLRANHCVSIFGEHEGRVNARAPLLGKPTRFAIGAPSLAWSEGAALMTAYPIRTGPSRYSLQIDDEIPVDRSTPRKAFAEAAVSEFARRLEASILRYPADWQGWTYAALRDDDARPFSTRP